MEPEVFQLLPVNSKSFQELLKKSAIILNICENLKIIPIVYGSFACFYHTQDENMPVNDLDLLVPEDSFPELINILKKNNIKRNYLYPSRGFKIQHYQSYLSD